MSPVYAKIRFNGYTLYRISTKNQFPKKPGFPLPALIILDQYPYVSLFPELLCNIASSITGLRKVRFNGYTLHRLSSKNQFPKKSGFPLPAAIILDWCNMDLPFKTENGQNRIMINKVYLAIPKLIGIHGLNLPEVGKLLVPSIPVKVFHMNISVEIR